MQCSFWTSQFPGSRLAGTIKKQNEPRAWDKLLLTLDRGFFVFAVKTDICSTFWLDSWLILTKRCNDIFLIVSLFLRRRKRAGITPIKYDLPPETKSPKKPKGSTVTVYTPPGRRAGASNGVVKGQTMPDGSRARGFRQGGRSRGRGRGWRGGRF